MQYVWDRFVRVFHWSLVIAFSVAFYTHASEWERLTHIRAGYVAGILLVARIVWGFTKTGYACFCSFPLDPVKAIKHIVSELHGNAKRYIGHNPAGSLAIYAMLVVGLLTVISGWLVYNDGWLIDEPDLLQTIHTWAAWTWLGLIVLHVLGVVTESILHKDNLIIAMITGCKRVSKKSEQQAAQL